MWLRGAFAPSHNSSSRERVVAVRLRSCAMRSPIVSTRAPHPAAGPQITAQQRRSHLQEEEKNLTMLGPQRAQRKDCLLQEPQVSLGVRSEQEKACSLACR